MIAVMPNAAVSSAAPSIKADEEAVFLVREFNLPSRVEAPPPPVFTPKGTAISSGYSVPPHQVVKWSNTREFRYSELATKRALGEVSEKEEEEFDSLLKQRRRAKNPPSADEIIFQYKRRQMEARLLTQLQEYANFIDAPRSPEE
ncbi:MAG: hypothetical protein ACREFX_10250 [Opitutaceae bacterium]